MLVGIGADGGGYWIHLIDYIHQKGEFRAILCTNQQDFNRQDSFDKVAVLFLQENFWTEKEWGIPVIYFSEVRGVEGGIYRFQPVEKLYQEMIGAIAKAGEIKTGTGKKIYAVYSPLGRCGKTAFSLAYAKEHSFFYIGMEEYGRKGKKCRGMEEVLYHVRNRKENIISMMLSLLEEWDGVLAIPSPVFFSDLCFMDTEDYRWFLEMIREDERVPSVIFDFGSGMVMNLEILDYFDEVFLPVLEGEESKEKLNCFWEYYEEMNGEQKEKIVQLIVPKDSWQKEDFLEKVRYINGLTYGREGTAFHKQDWEESEAITEYVGGGK